MATTTMTINNFTLSSISAGGNSKYSDFVINNSLIQNGTINSIKVTLTIQETKRTAFARGSGYIGYLNSSGSRVTPITISEIPRKNESAKTDTYGPFTPEKYNGSYYITLGAKNNMATINDINVSFSNITVYIDYTPAQYTITFKDENGNVLQSSKVNEGSAITAPTAPEKADTDEFYYTFDGWYDGAGNKWTSGRLATSDVTFTARYSEAKRTYTITATYGTGGTTKGTGLNSITTAGYPYGNIEYGSTVILEAIPDTGYFFRDWNDLNTDNPRTITVTENKTYTAFFEKGCKITLSYPEEAGSVIGTTDGAYHKNGSTLILEAVANPGYNFYRWEVKVGDGTTTYKKNNPLSLDITEDTTIRAVYTEAPPEILSAQLIYGDQQVSQSNKVKAGEGFIIRIDVQ